MEVLAHQGQGAASGVVFKRMEILRGGGYLTKALQARRDRMGVGQGDDVLLLARVVESKAKEGVESNAGIVWRCMWWGGEQCTYTHHMYCAAIV